MRDRIEDLASAFNRFPGIGPRQAKRFVYHLLAVPQGDRNRLADLIANLANDVRQCALCMRFAPTTSENLCNYCADPSRDDALLMVVEKDQDLVSVERTGTYRGRYFVLGGIITLSGKGAIRERDLIRVVEARASSGLSEIVLALSATSEGEHTADRVRELLAPLRGPITLSELGRGLATGSELEYADSATLSAALQNRKEA
ncbi:MAG TPA: toprim domain-containing protein [Candidatus Paceibacterota bacterium]|nr:toprim domain-containing protein [Candidatus Paceibacterota bacterium]